MYMCANYLFWNLCENCSDKDNDIYIFVHSSAILNLCKLDNNPMERCETVNKLVLKTFKNSIKISGYWTMIELYNYLSLTFT